jgi:hypothetical protein
MNPHVLVSLLLLVVLVPLFAASAEAWKAMKSPSTQPRTRPKKGPRNDTKRRFVRKRVLHKVN